MDGLFACENYVLGMRVTAICYGAMRDYLIDAAHNEAVIALDEGATVGDLVDALGAPRKLAASILIDERRGDLSEPLEDGMRVTLMPPFSGGEEEEPTDGRKHPG